MTLLEQLQTLENTLNDIEIHGQHNLEKLLGSIYEVGRLKAILAETQRGDEHGRQTDIGVDGSDTDNE